MVVNVEEDSLIGRWYNFETGDQGDMLDLVKQKKVGRNDLEGKIEK